MFQYLFRHVYSDTNVFLLTYIYRLYGLYISNSGLEKALKHWPNLVELKYVFIELNIIHFSTEVERMLRTSDSQWEWTKRHVHIYSSSAQLNMTLFDTCIMMFL